MRKASYLTILALFVATFAMTASAQKTRRTAPRPTPKPTPVRQTITPEVTAAKQKVANQLHNVNVFVDILGSVAVGIENREKDAAARRLKPKELEDHDLSKRKTVAAIRNLRDGLIALETEFRTKPQLAQYLPRIEGISTLSTQSEDSAIAGRFVAAKDPLRQVALKLNETIAVMPGPPTPGSLTTASPNRTIPVSTSSPGRPTSSVARRDPRMGMTTDQVLQSAWGAPSNKRTSKSGTGITEVWTYPGNRTLYFYNGEVTRIVQ